MRSLLTPGAFVLGGSAVLGGLLLAGDGSPVLLQVAGLLIVTVGMVLFVFGLGGLLVLLVRFLFGRR